MARRRPRPAVLRDEADEPEGDMNALILAEELSAADAEAFDEQDAVRQRREARFSAPCNIGPPIPGVRDGDIVEVAGDSPNAGRWTVVRVDKDWMEVAPRLIRDHEPRPGCTMEWVA